MTDAMEGSAALLLRDGGRELDRAAGALPARPPRGFERGNPACCGSRLGRLGARPHGRGRSASRRGQRFTLRGRTRCEHYWLIDAVAARGRSRTTRLAHEDFQIWEMGK